MLLHRNIRLLPWLLVALAACGDPEPVVTTTRIELHVPGDRTCRPTGEVSRLRVEALGDFPAATTDQRVETLGLDGPHTIDRFPVGTELLTVTAESGSWLAGGLHRVSDDAVAGMLLLPFGRSCSREDTAVTLHEGAAVVALPDGGLLLLGGVRDGERLRTIVRVPAPSSGELARVLAEPLSDPRVGATATRLGRRVVVAGGRGEDNDTYDLFDLDEETLDFGLLPSVRYDHAALALEGQRLLLVGGAAADGTALASAVVIDLDGGGSHTLESTLAVSRTRPQVLRLDDGSIYVVGGRDPGDRVARQVELFDVASERFVQVDGALLEDWEGAAAVALPGARIAWLGGESGDRAQVLALEGGPGGVVGIEVALDAELPTGEVSAVALENGTVLVVGEGEAALVDVGRGTVLATDWSRAATALVQLDDGSVAELGPAGSEGLSLRRELLRTRFDNPPNTLLPADRDWVALDVAPRWSGGTNVSSDDALATVPTLLFSDFRVTPVVEGSVDLILRSPQGPWTRVILEPGEADVLGCTLAHAPDDPVTLERRGDRLRLATRSGDERSCHLDLPPLVGLALRVLPGSTFVALSDLERL